MSQEKRNASKLTQDSDKLKNQVREIDCTLSMRQKDLKSVETDIAKFNKTLKGLVLDETQNASFWLEKYKNLKIERSELQQADDMHSFMTSEVFEQMWAHGLKLKKCVLCLENFDTSKLAHIKKKGAHKKMAELAQPMSQTKIYQIDEELSRIKNQKKTLKVLGDSEARVQVLMHKIWEIQ